MLIILRQTMFSNFYCKLTIPVKQNTHLLSVNTFNFDLLFSPFIIEYKWDHDKPDDISELNQGRQQIINLLDYNPGAQPKEVLTWLRAQKPNPQLSCRTNTLAKYMRRLRQCTRLSICRSSSSSFLPCNIKWNMRRPPSADLQTQRRIQLSRYLTTNPTHKSNQAMKWIKSHRTYPQPDCTTKTLSRLMNQI